MKTQIIVVAIIIIAVFFGTKQIINDRSTIKGLVKDSTKKEIKYQAVKLIANNIQNAATKTDTIYKTITGDLRTIYYRDTTFILDTLIVRENEVKTLIDSAINDTIKIIYRLDYIGRIKGIKHWYEFTQAEKTERKVLFETKYVDRFINVYKTKRYFGINVGIGLNKSLYSFGFDYVGLKHLGIGYEFCDTRLLNTSYEIHKLKLIYRF